MVCWQYYHNTLMPIKTLLSGYALRLFVFNSSLSDVINVSNHVRHVLRKMIFKSMGQKWIFAQRYGCRRPTLHYPLHQGGLTHLARTDDNLNLTTWLFDTRQHDVKLFFSEFHNLQFWVTKCSILKHKMFKLVHKNTKNKWIMQVFVHKKLSLPEICNTNILSLPEILSVIILSLPGNLNMCQCKFLCVR